MTLTPEVQRDLELTNQLAELWMKKLDEDCKKARRETWEEAARVAESVTLRPGSVIFIKKSGEIQGSEWMAYTKKEIAQALRAKAEEV